MGTGIRLEAEMEQGVATMGPLRSREEWLEERARGIGGSDGAAILGISPFATPLSVYLEKTGQAVEREQTERMKWGDALENVVALAYEEKTGRRVFSPGRRVFRHPDLSFVLGTPDRFVGASDPREMERGLEIKTADARYRDDWGEEGTDVIPDYYLVQCLHYAAIFGVDLWDCAVLIGGNDLRVYTIHRDLEFEAGYLDAIVDWWGKHIVGGEPVPIDGSMAAGSYLARRFPRHSAEIAKADSELAEIGKKYAAARAMEQAWSSQRIAAENAIKAAIGERAGVEGDEWRATWKRVKDTEAIDWEGVARDLHVAYLALGQELGQVWEANSLEEFVAPRTSIRPGYRRFLFTSPGAKRNGKGA